MTRAKIRNPEALVTTDWFANQMNDPELRIYDCSTTLQFEEGGKRPDHGLPIETG